MLQIAPASAVRLSIERADLVDHFVLIMLWVIALICLLLSQVREVLRQVRLTVQEWQATMDATRPKGRNQPPETPATDPPQHPAAPHTAGEQHASAEPTDADDEAHRDDPDAPASPAA